MKVSLKITSPVACDWDVVRGQVLTDLRKQKEDEEYALWLGALRSKAVIKINRDLLKETVPQISETD